MKSDKKITVKRTLVQINQEIDLVTNIIQAKNRRLAQLNRCVICSHVNQACIEKCENL